MKPIKTTICEVIKEDLHISLNNHLDAASFKPVMTDSYVFYHIKQIKKFKKNKTIHICENTNG
jgi:hypothetical protein